MYKSSMYLDYLQLIPDEILYYYIWRNISNNIKRLLNKKLFNKYYQVYYVNYYIKYNNIKYVINIIKNDVGNSLSLLLKNNNLFNVKKKWQYNNIIFFDYYSFLIYLVNKYKSYSCKKIINSIFSQIDIKEYKKYMNKNIRWTK